MRRPTFCCHGCGAPVPHGEVADHDMFVLCDRCACAEDDKRSLGRAGAKVLRDVADASARARAGS